MQQIINAPQYNEQMKLVQDSVQLDTVMTKSSVERQVSIKDELGKRQDTLTDAAILNLISITKKDYPELETLDKKQAEKLNRAVRKQAYYKNYLEIKNDIQQEMKEHPINTTYMIMDQEHDVMRPYINLVESIIKKKEIAVDQETKDKLIEYAYNNQIRLYEMLDLQSLSKFIART